MSSMLVGGLLIGLMGWGIAECGTPSAPTEDRLAGYDASKAPQRRRFVDEDLIPRGVFRRIDVHTVAGDLSYSEAIVGPAFYRADYETKEKFAAVAYAYSLDVDRRCESVIFRDSLTNKEVGEYWRTRGFKLNE